MSTKFKKVITSIVLIVMILNFISTTCLAASDEDSVWSAIGGTALNVVDGVVGVVTTKARVLMVIVTAALQGVTSILGYVDGSDGTANVMITVEEIFFNKLNITRIDFFDMDSSAGNISSQFRQNVAIWYYVLRNLAIIILLCILIYVGIRMAVSTVASEKAMYKNMFKDWVVSFILVFFMHYIIVVTIQVNNSLVEIMKPNAGAGWGSEYMNTLFINSIGINTEKVVEISAIKSWASAIIYAMMVFFTLAFLWTYVKRMITLAFLIVISPLVTVTYAIDKMGDGKSQALNAWLKEFIYNVLLQPFHCVIYLALMKTTIEQLTGSKATLGMGALAIMCMMFVFGAEKIVRKIFGFDKASTIADTMATTGAMIATMSNLKKIGPKGKVPAGASGAAKTAAKSTNSGLANNKIANKNIDRMKQAANSKMSQVAQTVSNSKVGQTAKAAASAISSSPIGNGAEKIADAVKKTTESAKQGAEKLANSDKAGERIAGNAALAVGNAAKNLGNDIKKDIKGAVGSIGDMTRNINTTAGATQAAMTMMGVAAGLTTGNAANAVTYGMAGNEIGSKMAVPAQEKYREKQERKLADNYKDIANSFEELDGKMGEYDLTTEQGRENMKEKCKEITEKGPMKVNKEFEKSYEDYQNHVKANIAQAHHLDPNDQADSKIINKMARTEMKQKYNEALNGNVKDLTNEISALESAGKNDEAESLRKFVMATKEKELSDNLTRMMGIEEALGDSEPEKTVVTGENSTIDRINEGLE